MQVAGAIKKKRKIRYIIIVLFPVLIIASAIVFVQFTYVGYCMSIRFRDFTEVKRNIYIDNSYTGNKNGFISREDVVKIIGEAKNRVADFFGEELHCDPVFIISDNADSYRKTGDKNTWTVSLNKVYSYISISHEYLNVDFMAHEITHAELNYRILNGKPFHSAHDFVPVWFDEGLASINDYRDIMSEEALQRKIELLGFVIRDVTHLTKTDLHGNDVSPWLIQENYLMCRHIVKTWIDKNGINALLLMIDGIRAGKSFEVLYNEYE